MRGNLCPDVADCATIPLMLQAAQTDNPQPASTTPPSLPSRIGLIAGEGQLPVHVARNATAEGIEVIPFAISRDNLTELEKACCNKPRKIVPGLLDKNLALLREYRLDHLVFAGKVNKWILLRDPRLDKRAMQALAEAVRLRDDDIMLWLVNGLAKEGFSVMSQTRFLPNLFLPAQTLTKRQPDERTWKDIAYGFTMAKEMGRLDIGQTVVVTGGMMIAVEAIEGTDECLKRSGKLLGKKKGVVVKVAKPNQDQRFDVPTVGLRTLKTMHKANLNVLAVEANETLFLDASAMTAFANRHNMSIVSVDPTQLPKA